MSHEQDTIYILLDINTKGTYMEVEILARCPKAVIHNRCATSWYLVCRKFLSETVFKY
jgi:hypothetical protein